MCYIEVAVKELHTLISLLPIHPKLFQEVQSCVTFPLRALMTMRERGMTDSVERILPQDSHCKNIADHKCFDSGCSS
jgi:hypothetical protein